VPSHGHEKHQLASLSPSDACISADPTGQFSWKMTMGTTKICHENSKSA